MVIHFHPLAVWNNSEDNKVEYVLPPGYGKFLSVNEMSRAYQNFPTADGGADWIGVYRENYTGFDEYVKILISPSLSFTMNLPQVHRIRIHGHAP